MNGGFAVMNCAPGRPIGLRVLRGSARQTSPTHVTHGLPEVISIDDGAEFTSRVLPERTGAECDCTAPDVPCRTRSYTQ